MTRLMMHYRFRSRNGRCYSLVSLLLIPKGGYSILLIPRYADERVIVYVVLRILNSSEESLKHFLPRLQIKLDVWAVNDSERDSKSGSKTEGSGPERDLVFSEALRDLDDPFIVLNAEDEEG